MVVASGNARGRDWADASRGNLDLVLVLAGVALVALGAFMTVQDYGHELGNAEAARTFDAPVVTDTSYREAHVPPLTALLALVGGVTTWRAYRVRRSARLSRHARRPLTLLLAGSGLLSFTYLVDTHFGLTAPYAVRAFLVTPLYAVAGVLVTGAAWRIRTLIRPLEPGVPED